MDGKEDGRGAEQDREQGEPCDRDVDRRHINQRAAQIGEDATPQTHRTEDRGEAVIEQDKVRRLARHIGPPTAHGDADVGRLKSRRVIDAVPGHGDHEIVGLEGAHQGQLLGRLDPGEDTDVAQPDGQELGRQARDLLAGHHTGGDIHSGVLRHLQRCPGVVARDHGDGDPGDAGLL